MGAFNTIAILFTLAAAFGSAYVNDFIQAGRVKRVFVQADAPFRRLAMGVASGCVESALPVAGSMGS